LAEVFKIILTIVIKYYRIAKEQIQTCIKKLGRATLRYYLCSYGPDFSQKGYFRAKMTFVRQDAACGPYFAFIGFILTRLRVRKIDIIQISYKVVREEDPFW
jgi:hypothetical protein